MYVLAYTEIMGFRHQNIDHYREVRLESVSAQEALEEARRRWAELKTENPITTCRHGDLFHGICGPRVREVREMGDITEQKPWRSKETSAEPAALLWQAHSFYEPKRSRGQKDFLLFQLMARGHRCYAKSAPRGERNSAQNARTLRKSRRGFCLTFACMRCPSEVRIWAQVRRQGNRSRIHAVIRCMLFFFFDDSRTLFLMNKFYFCFLKKL